MPFENSVAHAFTSNSIRAHAPAAPGVYGITNAREWIYIGVADDIRSVLLGHLGENRSQVMDRKPSGFVFELWDQLERTSRQNRLVMEYEPFCNRNWKP